MMMISRQDLIDRYDLWEGEFEYYFQIQLFKNCADEYFLCQNIIQNLINWVNSLSSDDIYFTKGAESFIDTLRDTISNKFNICARTLHPGSLYPEPEQDNNIFQYYEQKYNRQYKHQYFEKLLSKGSPFVNLAEAFGNFLLYTTSTPLSLMNASQSYHKESVPE